MKYAFVIIAKFYTDWTGSTAAGEVESLSEDTDDAIIGVANDEEKAALMAETFLEDHKTLDPEEAEEFHHGPLESIRVFKVPKDKAGLGVCTGEVNLATGAYKSDEPKRR